MIDQEVQTHLVGIANSDLLSIMFEKNSEDEGTNTVMEVAQTESLNRQTQTVAGQKVNETRHRLLLQQEAVEVITTCIFKRIKLNGAIFRKITKSVTEQEGGIIRIHCNRY